MAKRTVDERERQLITELYDALRRFAAVTGSYDIEPDDLLQEAFARTLARHKLTDLDNPAAYIRKTIVNLASNQRRGLARRRTALARLATDDDVMPTYPSDVEAILDLPPKHRAVLYLVYVEQMPYREVAEQLGISPVAARKTASRAKRRARLNLGVDHG